jgi:hypothetical protein
MALKSSLTINSPLEEPVREAVAGVGIDSKRLCNEGSHKALLDATTRSTRNSIEDNL